MDTQQRTRLVPRGRRFVFAALLALGASGAGAWAAAQERVQPASHAREGSAATTHARPLAPPHALGVVGAINHGEIELARLARGRTANAQVRELASELIRDHSQSQARVDEWALARSLTPVANDDEGRSIRREALATRRRLEALSGEAFDRAYVDSQVTMHRAALATIDDQIIPTVRNAQLREILESLRRSIESHMNRASAIQRGMTQTVRSH
jgi:putative membrane protein